MADERQAYSATVGEFFELARLIEMVTEARSLRAREVVAWELVWLAQAETVEVADAELRAAEAACAARAAAENRAREELFRVVYFSGVRS
jgi:hypothetical protein